MRPMFLLLLTTLTAMAQAPGLRRPDAAAPGAVPFAIQAPAAGTRWCLGTQQTLRWTTTLPQDRMVRLELLDGVGNVFKVIAPQVPNRGNHLWTLDPAQYVFGEGTFRLRITTPDGSAQATTSHTFVLGKPLSLSAPQPQHIWRTGSTYTIRWMNGCAIPATAVKVELLDGARQPLQVLAPAAPLGQSLSWTVPATLPTGTYHLRLTTSDGAHRAEGAFKVDAPVAAPTQSTSLAILAPETGARWCVGEPQTVRWRTSLPAATRVKVELLRSDNSPFRVLAADAPNTGTFTFTLTAAEFGFGSGTLRLRLSTSDGTVVSTTGNFQLGKPIMLSNPKAQYTWRKGSAYTISWMAGCPTPGATVTLELLDAARNPLRTLVQGHPVDQSYRWTVPADLPVGRCHIRVSLTGTSHQDVESFTLAEPAN